MFTRRPAAMVLALVTGGVVGCHTPPPPRVPVPAPNNRDATFEHDPVKPLPEPRQPGPPPASPNIPPSQAEPAVPPPQQQQPPPPAAYAPEQRSFVDAYQRVGRPRIAVFVNRSLHGEIVSVAARAAGEPSLRPGQYDASQASALDYDAVEQALAEWIGSGGQVTVIPDATVRQMLAPDRLKDLESGRPAALAELAKQVSADVLVQAQLRPVQQGVQGLQVRMTAEALNTQGGELVSRASADVAPPLDREQLSSSARGVAQKLTSGMVTTWTTAPPAAAPAAAAPER